MSSLEIKLLGPPEVCYQGRILKFRSRKVLALLIYLVVEGELHSRDKLVALLWPESSHERGMASLRNTLARLRQSLSPAGQFLLSKQGMIGFDFGQDAAIDLRVLQTAVQPHSPQEALQSALALHRGPFLAGHSLPDAPEYDDWLVVQRSFWEQRWNLVFDRLSQQQLADGRSHASVETAARWLAEAPYNESDCRRLMKAYALAGDRVSALRVYEQFREVLETELGIVPAPETAELAERIANEPAKTAVPSQDKQLIISSPAERLVIPFVGRRSEQEKLRASYYKALHSELQVAAVIGEAGLGKTQLVERFLTWAALEEKGAVIPI